MNMSLRFWILLLITFTILGMIASTLFAGYYVSKNNLITHTKEINRVYSEKLAQVTDQSLQAMEESLENRALDMAALLDNQEALRTSLDQFLRSSHYFNSIAIVDKEAKVITSAPDLDVVGYHVHSIGINEALEKQETVISELYDAAIGRKILLISSPIWTESGTYEGMLAGTVYLQESNIIESILGEHFSQDGSYVYVVDHNGVIIYHPERSRIGENAQENPVVQKLMNGESGTLQVTNTKEKDMLAGFSHIPTSNWGIVSQTPYDVSIQPVWDTIRNMVLYSIPFIFFTVLLSIIFAERIASPLRQLALQTYMLKNQKIPKERPSISTWYFEATQLNQTIQTYIDAQEDQLQTVMKDSQTDPLTGLPNRRYIDTTLQSWIEEKPFFSMIILDIDYFKMVNDTYGHQMGDEILIFFGEALGKVVGENNLFARYGGEEFMILLPEATVDEALKLAHRLKYTLANMIAPSGKKITFSAGVGCYRNDSENLTTFMQRVDEALYRAKQSGRNRCEVAMTKKTS
ncbi:sensor domain-containing diguanylate cyclase [Alkalihalophilus lindianensis]|uniref:Sensor domain-containing diguanylate cyclase n=1 Tax=Alkalihalophilus lindianensis TaxID=1630542 RepID=A0ABU3X5A1_9BACI|nr:sensor domain-containing diguanylate cyclase [Alkalihalophilus lindianensis]MDV2682963.1 sensor domain-containing diguanylate cyclase [Alkalihalophilus lindianensis]